MFSTSASQYLTSAALLPLCNGPKPQSFNAFQGSWLNPSSEFNQEALLILESTKAQLHDLRDDRKRQSLNTSPGIQCLQPGTGMCSRSGVLLPGLVSVSPPEEQDPVPQLATDWGLQKSPALSSGPPGLSCKSTMEQSVGSLQPWKEFPLNSSLPRCFQLGGMVVPSRIKESFSTRIFSGHIVNLLDLGLSLGFSPSHSTESWFCF